MVYSVLNECLVHGNLKRNNILNEISSDDAYIKFYSNIPKDLYDTVMSDTNKMTPFHKALLDVVKDFVEHGTNNRTIQQYIGEIKNIYQRLTPGQKKYCVQCIKDGKFGFTNNHFDLKKILRASEKYIEITNKAKATNGLVVLYNDDNILVTCTLTYAASRHFYGNTHWCTASGIFGQFSGYQSFRTYVKNDRGDYCLIQFVFKKLVNEIYQGMFDKNREPEDFKDFNDDGDLDTFKGVVDYIDSIVPNLYEDYVKPRIPELIRLTSDAYSKEEEEMRPILTKKVESIVEKFPQIPTIEELNKKLRGIKNVNGISYNGLRVREKTTKNYTLFSLTQTTSNLSEYQLIQQTKDITKIDFKSKSFVYSWIDHEVLNIPELFSDNTNRALLLFGDSLFSCALYGQYDTSVLNLSTMETKHYNAKYDGVMMGTVRFETENGDSILFSLNTGQMLNK